MIKKIKRLASIMLAAMLIFASAPVCQVSAAAISPGTSTVSGASYSKKSVAVGGAIALGDVSITLKDTAGNTATFTLEEGKNKGYISNPAISADTSTGGSKTGKVTFGEGTYSKGGSATFTYTVDAIDNAIKASVSPNTLYVGSKATVTVKNAKGTVTYSSSNSKVATVGKTTGVITAKKKGTATITINDAGNATYKGSTAEVTITVKAVSKSAKAQKVTLAPPSGSVKAGKTAKVKISGIKTSTPTVSSSRTSVATVSGVSKTGFTIRGVKAGTAKITVSVPSNSKYKAATVSMTVTVSAASAKTQSIKVSPSKVTLTAAKKTQTLKVSKAKTKVSYATSNSKVAKVNSKGKITRVGKGSCTITVTAKATSKYLQSVKTVKVTCK